MIQKMDNDINNYILQKYDVKVEFYDNSKIIKIFDTTSILDIESLAAELLTMYPIKRTLGSTIREIKAHYVLAKLHMFLSHTIDTDIEQNEKMYRRICYIPLSFVYDLFFRKEKLWIIK